MNQTERDSQYINCLTDFICTEYNITPVSITSAKRGWYGETWRADTSDHSYFIKLVYIAEHKNIYERSFPIIDHLCNHGIDFISRIIKTADGRLFTRFDGAVLGVFEWIDGENTETDETKIYEYQMLAKVYTIPSCGIEIIRENFSGTSADDFFRQRSITTDRHIISLLEKNRAKLEYRAERLKHFAELCRGDTTGYVITHGDAGGNFIKNGEKHYIIDWDEPIFAPPERDAWVMGFRDWAKCLFNKSLRQSGINYTLRTERLAYYCYHMFFYWLTWLTRCSQADEIKGYFNDWDKERIEYADNAIYKN